MPGSDFTATVDRRIFVVDVYGSTRFCYMAAALSQLFADLVQHVKHTPAEQLLLEGRAGAPDWPAGARSREAIDMLASCTDCHA